MIAHIMHVNFLLFIQEIKKQFAAQKASSWLNRGLVKFKLHSGIHSHSCAFVNN
jgi:hypothetical protein